MGGWNSESIFKYEYKFKYEKLSFVCLEQPQETKLYVLISLKNKTSWIGEKDCLSEDFGFSVSAALANSFIKWHFPLHCSLGLSLFSQSTLLMYS